MTRKKQINKLFLELESKLETSKNKKYKIEVI